MEQMLNKWLDADKAANEIKNQIVALQLRHGEAVHKLNQIMEQISSEMKANGVLEECIKGEHIDFVIYFTTPRQSVKVEDVDAVPDQFCKIERKPKLKEIGDYLRKNQVNWATFHKGEGSLAYKAVKHKA